MHVSSDYDDMYSCRAEIWAKFGEVEAFIDLMNYFYSANITAGNSFQFYGSMGARTYESLEATSSTQLGESQNVEAWFYVPELSIFNDFEAAEDAFLDIISADDDGDHFDMLGETWGHKELIETSTDGTETFKDAFTSVQFGYKLSRNETEPTYLGIQFAAEFPADKMVEGVEIVNWAKYTLYDSEGNEVPEMSNAVACISKLGDRYATEMKYYEKVFDIESMDDAQLEDLELSDSPWELQDIDSEYYDLTYEGNVEGNGRQYCLVAMVWEDPTGTEDEGDLGWYVVESGARLIDPSEEADNPVIIDIPSEKWEVEYRKPEAIAELDV